jgi:hypothetical protein
MDFSELISGQKNQLQAFLESPSPGASVQVPELLDFRNVLVEIAEQSLASEAFKYIRDAVHEFQSKLNDNAEVGLRLIHFGQDIILRVDKIICKDPNILTFVGVIDGTGNQAVLIQHINQLNFMLTLLAREDPEKPRRPIGFQMVPVDGHADGTE